jgi:ketosteroid isomerase-like protein
MRTLFAIAVLVLVAACQTAPPEMTEAEIAQAESETRQAIAERWAGYKAAELAGDVEEYWSFWTPTARLYYPSMTLVGDDLYAFVSDFWGSGGKILAFEIESFEVFVHEDVAYEIGQYGESIQFPDGTLEEYRGNVSVRWVKGDDGSWRIDRFLTGPVADATEG